MTGQNSPAVVEEQGPQATPYRPFTRKTRVGLILALVGFLVFLLGARPGFFGLDRSSVIGFVQIAVFLIGLAMICIGGYLSLASLWTQDGKSIAADIGLRLVATGYLICVFAGMADVFGFGSQLLPDVPYFGYFQERGVEMGQIVIAIGFLMLIPYRRIRTPRGAA